MADRFALDLTAGPAFIGPDLPTAEDQYRQRQKLLDPGRHASFIVGGGGVAQSSVLDRPSFVQGGPALDLPAPELSGDTRLADYGRQFGAGFLDIAQGIAGTIELTGIVPQGSITGAIAQEAEEVMANLTPSARRELEREWASVGEDSVLQNPKSFLLQLSRVFPSIGASFGGAAVGAAGAVGRLGRGASAAQRAAAAGRGGAVGAAATEAAQVGGATMNEIADMMNQVPHAKLLEQSEVYRRNFAQSGDEGEARRQTILDASRSTAAGNALFSALTAMLPGYVFGRMSQRVGPTTRGGRAGQTAGAEAFQEGTQESGTGIMTGMAYQENIDPNFDPYAEAGERFVAGAALGAGAGGVVGALAPGGAPSASTDDLPPEVVAALPPPQGALPPPQGALPAPEETPPYGGELPPPQLRLPDLPIPVPDPNQPIEMGGFVPATQEQQELALGPEGPPVPGAMGPPQPGPQLDTTQRPDDGSGIAQDLINTVLRRRRYTYIPPDIANNPEAQNALGAVLNDMRADDAVEGLAFFTDPQGGTLVSYNQQLVQEYADTGKLPAPTPDVNKATSGPQLGFPLTQEAEPAPPPAGPRGYPGGMTREQYEAADATLQERRADRATMEKLAQRVAAMDAQRLEQGREDLFGEDQRAAPQTRKTAYAQQIKQLEELAKSVEDSAAQGTLTDEDRQSALETLDRLAVTTDRTSPTMTALSEDFETVRELVDQYRQREIGFTEALNLINEMLGGKRGEEFLPGKDLKQVQEVLAGEPEPTTTYSPKAKAARKRIEAAKNAEPTERSPQRDLFAEEQRNERLARGRAKQARRRAVKKEQAERAAEPAKRRGRRQELAKAVARRREQERRRRELVEQVGDDLRTPDEQELAMLIRQQQAEMGVTEVTQVPEEVPNLGVDMMVDIEGAPTGELVFEEEFGEEAAAPPASKAAPPAPPKKRKRKKAQELSDEDRAWREAAKAAADAAGDGRVGTTNVASGGGRSRSVEDFIVPSSPVAETLSSSAFTEQYPNAVELQEHQRAGINMVLGRMNRGKPGAIIGDGTGAGKTLQAAVVADQVRRNGGKVLMVTTGGRNADVFPKAMRQLGVDMSGIEQKSYSTLDKADVGKYDLVVYDEAHNLKNMNSTFFQRFLAIESDFNLFLSATPADMDSSLTLFALAQGYRDRTQLERQLGVQLNEQGEVDSRQIDEKYLEKLADMVYDLVQDGAYFRRALPRLTQYEEVVSKPDTTKYKDELTGESRTLKEWDDALAAAPGSNPGVFWARSAKLAEIANYPSVIEEIDTALAEGRQVIVMAQRHKTRPVEFTSQDGTKHRIKVPSILDMVEQYLQDTGRGDLVHKYYGDKGNVTPFQEGKKPILLTTYGKASESIDLDDQVGDRPRTLISTLADWSASKEDQAIGRVDRASTQSIPLFRAMRADGFTADIVRSSRLQSKAQLLKVLQGETTTSLSYENNVRVEERGDRVFVTLTGMYYQQQKVRALRKLIEDVSGGFPNWKYLPAREAHSIDKDVWPAVQSALQSVFEAQQVSNLETDPEPVSQPEPEEVVTEMNDNFEQPQELPESENFFDRAAEKLARQYEISEDDLVWEGTGPGNKVTVDDVERYWQASTGFESQSFDLFNVSRGLLSDTVPVLAKDLLMDIQKNTKRSSPMYDLLRTMIRRIGNTTVQLDAADHHNYAGSYNIRGDQIRISPRSNTNKTLMHEALHAVIGHTIETNPEFRRRVQKLREEFLIKAQSADLTEQMSSIVREILASTDENAHEFMSYALTEPEFQQVMKDMPSRHNPNQSLWQKFKAMVAKVLRLPRRARTAFDDLVDLAKEGATVKRQRDIPGAVGDQQQFSMAYDAAKPIWENIQRYKGNPTRRQMRSLARRKATGILTLRQLETMYKGVLDRLAMGNPVKKWIDALHRKEVTMKQYATTGNKRYRDYRAVEAAHPESVQAFRQLIRNSTIYQIHPDLPLDHASNKGVREAGHEAEYNAQRRDWQNLPPAMRREYKKLRKFYRDERNFELKQQLVNALAVTEAQIAEGGRWVNLTKEKSEAVADELLSGRRKPSEVVLNVDGQIDYRLSELLQERIRENREHMLQRGPYFPLKRFGQFTAYGERDRRAVTATLDSDEISGLETKAAEWTVRRSKRKQDDWTDIERSMYQNRREHLMRNRLTDKLNEQIRKEAGGEPTRQRSSVEFNADLTSATRDHYDVYYSQHDTQAEAFAEAKRLQEEGYDVAEFEGEPKIGRRPDEIPQAMAAFGPLLASLRARLESKQMKAGKGKGTEYDRLFKALEASLLATLPETSVRVEALKRKNVPGSTNDAGRSLAAHVRGRAFYRGQLLHGQEIGEALAGVNTAHRAVERDNRYSQADQDRVQAVMDEVRKHDAMDSSQTELQEIYRGMANIGFLWVLLSPVYILVNMTQPGMFTLPWLAARSKQGGAIRAGQFLKQAYGVMMPEFISRSKEARGGLFGLNFNVDQELFDFLDPDGESIGRKLNKRILNSDLKYKEEMGDVLAELAAKNLLDMTLAADTRSAAAGHNTETWWERTMDSARIMPHLTEVLNRGVTAVAAYEMGRSEGMSKEQAQRFAEDAIAETQFDYSLLNKPRYMSERSYQMAKPLFMFMQHPQHVYALFIKSALFGTRGAKTYWKLKRSGEFDSSNPEHRKAERDYKENRDTVAGILATHLLMGGVAGALFEPAKWGLGMVLMVNEMLTGEPPEDTKTYVNRWLVNLAGSEGGNALMHGLPYALAGLDFSSNLSLSTLATFDTRYKEGREGFQDRVFSLLGPLPALGGNLAEGLKDIKDGDTLGGTARMMPRTLREIMRAAKASDTGIQDSRGNVLIGADDMSAYELFANAMGINTAQKSRMYKERAATMNLKYGHRDKQNRLKERLRRADTPGKRRAAMAAIAKYNRTVPFYARINIYGSRAASARTQQQIDRGGGVILGRKEAWLKQEF